jgi:hypothetical protein
VAKQIEQCRFDAGDGVNGDAQIEGLQAAAAGIPIRELPADAFQHRAMRADALAHDERLSIFQRLANALAAGYFPNPDVSGVVRQDHDVASEVGAVRAAEVQQHAVFTGDGNHLHRDDARCTCK